MTGPYPLLAAVSSNSTANRWITPLLNVQSHLKAQLIFLGSGHLITIFKEFEITE